MKWLDGITDSTDMTLQTMGDGEGQGNLECCSPWGCEETDTTEQQNSNNLSTVQAPLSSVRDHTEPSINQ